ncbi:MAG: hypothetical protein AB8B59_16820 [Maribacter sp.]
MLLNRIHEYLLHENMSFNKFEISLEVSHGSISNAWKREKNIGSNVIEKILKIYPEIRAEWLLRGEGDMFEKRNRTELILKDLKEKKSNEKLISQTLKFLKLKNKSELQEYFEKLSYSKNAPSLEQVILQTWENKYGQELETVKLQLMTLFTSQLDNDMKSKNKSSKSKVS